MRRSVEAPLSRKADISEIAVPWDAHIGHSCRSRTRLSFPYLRGKTQEFTALCDGALKLKGVRQVEGRPLTGSLIVTHDGSADDLAHAARKAGLFNVKAVAQEHKFHDDARQWKETVDRALNDAVGHGIDARAIGGLAFLAVALGQLATGRVMPPAATALWYALNLIAPSGRAAPPPE